MHTPQPQAGSGDSAAIQGSLLGVICRRHEPRLAATNCTLPLVVQLSS